MAIFDIIIPSYNDNRILNAIASVIRNDNYCITRIIVIDGESNRSLLSEIKESLRDHDCLLSEPDAGIFDAFNKGLSLCTSRFIGWIGSDDYYTNDVNFSRIGDVLRHYDIYIGKLYYFKGNRVTRIASNYGVRFGLVKYGFNNPHFSTFGRREILTKVRFDPVLRGADIKYFIEVFNCKPRVYVSDRFLVCMQEGGFSNRSFIGILKGNIQLIKIYGPFISVFAIFLKVSLKIVSRIWFKLVFLKVPE